MQGFILALCEPIKHDHSGWLSLPDNEIDGEILARVKPRIYASVWEGLIPD